MTSIPVTAKEFEAWSAEHKAEWPPELQAEKFAPNAWASWARDLMNFAEAYGKWKAER